MTIGHTGDVDHRPVEPPASSWQFPDVANADEHGLVCVGGDLEPGTLLAAYRAALFPMPVPTGRGRRSHSVLGWFSPDPRALIPLDGLHVSRTLRRVIGRFRMTSDVAFEAVMRACGDPSRPHGWITDSFVDAYSVLHRLGWAHSVEVWLDDELVGGVYGLAIGGLFAGESMFHRATNASKVALVGLVERLDEGGFVLFDVQWLTEHLASLGAVEVPRSDYLAKVRAAVDVEARWV